MCKYCQQEEIILKKKTISETSWGFGNIEIKLKDAYCDTYGLFIDKRDEVYLRFTDVSDSDCIESGQKIKINFCPFCGKEF